MTIMRIKRSTTAGNPGTLAQGELAYSDAPPGTPGRGRLYIGMGPETFTTGSGYDASQHLIIGGTYFTDMMSHQPGTLTTGSAIITDNNNSIDALNVGVVSVNGATGSIFNNNRGTVKDLILAAVTNAGMVTLPAGQKFKVTDLTQNHVVFVGPDGALAESNSLTYTTTTNKLTAAVGIIAGNIDITGNTLTSTTLNGDINISPSGTGKVRISGKFTLPITSGTDKYVLTSDGLGGTTWSQPSTTLSFNVDGSAPSTTVNLLTDTLFFNGSTGIRTSSSATGVTFTLDRASTTDPGIAFFTATTFAVNSSGLVSIKAGGITNAQLASSGITFGTASVNLGDTVSSIDLFSVTGGNVKLIGSAVTATSGSSNLSLHGSGSGKVSISGAYTLPNTDGTSGQALITDGSGIVTFQSISTNLRILADIGSTSTTVGLLTDYLNIAGGNGISTQVSTVGTSTKVITVSGVDATTSDKGVAKFSTSSFIVSSGNVELATSVIKQITVDNSATVTPLANAIRLLGGIGISVNTLGSDITVSSDYASYTTAGVAKFDSTVFTVNTSNGLVSIGSGAIANAKLANSKITIGNTDISLGTTSTVLTGVTDFEVGQLRFLGNQILGFISSATGVDVNINLRPQGNGTVDLNNSRITNLGNPVDPFDAANKAYVDALSVGLKIKESVRAATPTPLSSATNGSVIYNTGTNGIGSYLQFSSPLNVLDSVPLVAGDRILVKDEESTATNGIYVYNSATRITRATDYDQPSEVKGGEFVFVTDGITYGKTGWVQTELTTAIGTSTIIFQQFSGAGTYIAGNGLTLIGNVFNIQTATFGGIEIVGDAIQLKSSVAGDGLTYNNSTGIINAVGTLNRISVLADSIDIAATYAGQSSIATVGIVTSGTWQANPIGPEYGGTGLTSIIDKGLLIGGRAPITNVPIIEQLAIGNAGEVLQVNAGGNGLRYGDIDGGTY